MSAHDHRARRSTAILLLAKVMATEAMTADRVARELVATEAEIGEYLAGEREMPLDRQLRLAAFVIATVPALSRLAYRLRGQVAATAAYRARDTETHASEPPRAGWR